MARVTFTGVTMTVEQEASGHYVGRTGILPDNAGLVIPVGLTDGDASAFLRSLELAPHNAENSKGDPVRSVLSTASTDEGSGIPPGGGEGVELSSAWENHSLAITASRAGTTIQAGGPNAAGSTATDASGTEPYSWLVSSAQGDAINAALSAMGAGTYDDWEVTLDDGATVVEVDAGDDETVAQGSETSIDAEATVHNPSGATTFAWTRVSGVGGSLSATDIEDPIFTAPTLAPDDADRTIVWRLTVTNNGVSETSDKSFTVKSATWVNVSLYVGSDFIQPTASGRDFPANAGLLIPPELLAADGTAFLRRFRLTTSPSVDQEFQTSTADLGTGGAAGPEMAQSWRSDAAAIRIEGDGRSIEIPGPNYSGNSVRDNAEPFDSWRMSSAKRAELNTFKNFFTSGQSHNFDITLLNPPTIVSVDAGSDETLYSGETQQIDATVVVQNSSGDTVYEWTRVSGTGGSLSALDVEDPVFTAPTLDTGDADRTIIWRLTVTNNGVSASSDKTFTVRHAPPDLLVIDSQDSQVWKLTNADDPDATGAASLLGSFPAAMGTPRAIARHPNGSVWVIAESPDELWEIPNIDQPGTGTNHGAIPSGINWPHGLAFDDAGSLYALDNDGDEAWLFADPTSPGDATELGDLPSGVGIPRGLSFYGGAAYLVDQSGELVRIPDLTVPGTGTTSSLPSGLTTPRGIEVDQHGRAWIVTGGGDLWTLRDLSDPSNTGSNRGSLPAGIGFPDGVTRAPLIQTLPATDFRSGEVSVAGGIETVAPDDSVLPETDFRPGLLSVAGGVEAAAPDDSVLPDTDFRPGELSVTGGVEAVAPDDSVLPDTDFTSGELSVAGGIEAVAPDDSALPDTDFRSGQLSVTGGVEAVAPSDSVLPDTDFRSGEITVSGGVEAVAPGDSTLPSTEFRSGGLSVTGGVEAVAPDDSTLPDTDFSSGELSVAGGIEAAAPDDTVLPNPDFRSGELSVGGGVEAVAPGDSTLPATDFRSGQLGFAGGIEATVALLSLANVTIDGGTITLLARFIAGGQSRTNGQFNIWSSDEWTQESPTGSLEAGSLTFAGITGNAARLRRLAKWDRSGTSDDRLILNAVADDADDGVDDYFTSADDRVTLVHLASNGILSLAQTQGDRNGANDDFVDWRGQGTSGRLGTDAWELLDGIADGDEFILVCHRGGTVSYVAPTATLPETDFRSGGLAVTGGVEAVAPEDQTLSATDFRSGPLAADGGIEVVAPADTTLPDTDFRSGALSVTGGIEAVDQADVELPTTSFRSGSMSVVGGVQVVGSPTLDDPATATEEPYPVTELGAVPSDSQASVVWNPPSIGDPVSEVLVDFRRDDEDDWGGLQRIARTSVVATIPNLENDRNYYARVRNDNPIGPSVARIVPITPTGAADPDPPAAADSNLVEAAFAEATASVILLLATITHRELNTPIRVVNNTENIESRGETYVAFPFEALLPTETDEEPGSAKLSIDNVSQEIATAIRSLTDAPMVKIEVVLAHAPNVVERTYPTFKLRNVEWNTVVVMGDLLLDDLRTESFPPGSFSPSAFPGLF